MPVGGKSRRRGAVEGKRLAEPRPLDGCCYEIADRELRARHGLRAFRVTLLNRTVTASRPGVRFLSNRDSIWNLDRYTSWRARDTRALSEGGGESGRPDACGASDRGALVGGRALDGARLELPRLVGREGWVRVVQGRDSALVGHHNPAAWAE